MAVDPDDIHAISASTVQLYRDTELHLLRLIATYLERGIDAPTWAQDRLAHITALRIAAERALAQAELAAAEAIRQHLAEAYRTGYGAALTALELAQLGQDTLDAARTATTVITRTAAMESLAAAVVRDIGDRSRNVLRHVVDVYRRVVTQASALSIAGGLTRRQASQAAYARFVAEGVTSFTDIRGRRWRLSSYVEMALRTVTQRAAVQGQEDRQTSLGLDLMIVSNSPGECPLCRPWEHKILSISGQSGRVRVRSVTTGRMVTVDVAAPLIVARAAGLQHPNCTHALRAYLPGATVIPATQTADPEHHDAKERQREIERAIRRWKEREAAALTPEAKTAARRKVRAWQQEMRNHLAENPRLKRLPYREQIGAGNLPPRRDDNTPTPTPSPTPSPTPDSDPQPLGRGQDAVPVTWWYQGRRVTGIPEGDRDDVTRALTNWVFAKRRSGRENIAEPMVNSALRGVVPMTPELANEINTLDRVMDMSRTTRPITVYRGYSDGTRILPADWEHRDLAGLTWTNEGYTSTSDSLDLAETYAGEAEDRGFAIRIALPAGSSAFAIRDEDGGLDDEGEIVLPRDTRLRVVADHGAQGDYGIRLLDVEVEQRPPSPVPHVDEPLSAEDRARQRQAKIDTARDVAHTLAEVDAWREDGLGKDAMARALRVAAGRRGLPTTLVDALIDAYASGDRGRIDATIASIAADAGLSRTTGAAGTLEPYDRARHQIVGGAQGTPPGTIVWVVEPGYDGDIDGETLRLRKGVVEPADADEIRDYRSSQ